MTLIQRKSKRLAVIVVVAMVIVAAVVLTWWWYNLSPAGRVDALAKIRRCIVFGLLSGGVYALLALGFTLIYGVAEVVNMAHGALYMLGAYMFYAFSWKYLQLDPLPALFLAVIVVAFIGMITYMLFIHPVIEDVVAVMVVTVGVTLIFQQLILLNFGKSDITVTLPFSELEYILGVPVTRLQILALVTSLSLISMLWIFIRKSKIGRAMRAVAQDRETAMLMGINTERLYMLTMAISASFAALAGILIAAQQVAEPRMWTVPLTMSFAIVILGGLGSIKGSLVGAFIIGYAEKFVTIGTGMWNLEGVASLTVMVLVLLFRPAGLFGKRLEVER